MLLLVVAVVAGTDRVAAAGGPTLPGAARDGVTVGHGRLTVATGRAGGCLETAGAAPRD